MQNRHGRQAFWRGKRVLITGHSGFKGSWLSLWLQQLGADVLGYSLPPPTSPSLFEQAHIAPGISSIMADVRDLDRLSEVVEGFGPEVVFHLAAQSLVHASYVDPVETYATNLMGTVNVLEAVRHTEATRALVIVTSDKCYENQESGRPYQESDPMGGHDPYSSSKGCAELIVSAYRRSFFGRLRTAVASARAGNVIGGGDWSRDRLVPDMMRAALAGEAVRIRRPNAVRPWQHVLDPLAGYLALAEGLCENGEQFAEGWNFGPADADARPVSWVVEHVAQRWGKDFRWELDTHAHPHEAVHLNLDCSKARSRLDWAPKLPLPVALDWTARWYRAYQAAGDLRAVTLAQIDAYEHAEVCL